jgi:tellurite resistance protein TerC
MTESLQTFPAPAWAAFILFIAAMMGIDLGVFRKESREIGLREVLGWCTVWISFTAQSDAQGGRPAESSEPPHRTSPTTPAAHVL